MDGLFGVILVRHVSPSHNRSRTKAPDLGEGLDLSAMTTGALPGKESEGAVARRFVLPDALRPKILLKSETMYLTVTTDHPVSFLVVSSSGGRLTSSRALRV